jgi:hypothetical protein
MSGALGSPQPPGISLTRAAISAGMRKPFACTLAPCAELVRVPGLTRASARTSRASSTASRWSARLSRSSPSPVARPATSSPSPAPRSKIPRGVSTGPSFAANAQVGVTYCRDREVPACWSASSVLHTMLSANRGTGAVPATAKRIVRPGFSGLHPPFSSSATYRSAAARMRPGIDASRDLRTKDRNRCLAAIVAIATGGAEASR